MSSWTDRLRELIFGRRGFLDGEIVVNVPEAMYFKELAVYCAVSLIANAVSQCEILTYEDGKPVRGDNWYSLNVAPNINESAPKFWHKVTERMLRAQAGKGAFVFVQNGKLYCADEYNVKEKRPFKATGNLYDGVVVDELQLNKTFTGREAMVFRLEEFLPGPAVTDMYSELSGLVSAAMDQYKDTNTQRWKFKIAATEAGNEEFQTQWQTKLKQAVQSFVGGDTKIYVEYKGMELDRIQTGESASAGDSVQLIDKAFDLVSRAYHIPPGLLNGGNYNMNDLMVQFLTFVVDPIGDVIGKTLTGAYYTASEFAAGNYFRVDTSKVKHFDIFNLASDVDKLISSGFATVNEVRRAADWDAAGDPNDPDNWLNQHILTKNYEKGGEKQDAESKNV